MHYWLFKSEPTTFSIDDLKHAAKQTTHWEGVRNYQVRNMMRDHMQVGDHAFFYHSNCTQPGIAGTMKIVKAAYPDHSAWDNQSHYFDPKSSPSNPIWLMVDVQFIKKFDRLITLNELKKNPALDNMLVTRRGNRLSITPVTSDEWKTILSIS